ncbi:MAG: putative siderophore transport system ATP-binding protein YusV [Candidatus Erwinia impunctatus]|nr:putative siderophore transport system ATP-binding protein YusV [Culicoides impunctatus]
MEKKTSENSIVLHDLQAGYARQVIIDNIQLTIPTSKITVLIGANGSGKSTLLNTMARLISPLSGHVLLNGKDIHQQPTKVVSRQLGLLPQSPILPEGLTVFELVSRGRFPWQNFLQQWSQEDEAAVTEAMALTGTLTLSDRPVDSLSGGQRQRCWIAMALAQQTPVILLDEPTTFLDLRYQVEIMELLHTLSRDHQRTIVVILHDLNFALNYGDTLIFLKKGHVERILHDKSECTTELINSVFDIDVQMVRRSAGDAPFFIPFPPRRA